MGILSAFIIFDVLIIVYELIVGLFSAVYELSGLTKEQARFQVTSLLTGTGFTTAESEKMLETKKRKRITRDIMIISYIFNISIISTSITLFTSTNLSSYNDLIIGVLISLILVIILLCSKRITALRKIVDKSFIYIVGLLYYKRENPIIAYDYYGTKILAEITLNKIPSKIKDMTLSELNLDKKYNIRILSIRRSNKVITNIKKDTIFMDKDILLVIGKKSSINKVFRND